MFIINVAKVSNSEVNVCKGNVSLYVVPPGFIRFQMFLHPFVLN